MVLKKIAMIFPYAPLYRGPIYTKIDQNFEVDWFFCNNSGHGLKQMDYTKLKCVNLSMRETLFRGASFWYKGLRRLPFSNYDSIIIPGQTRCLAEWYISIKYGHKTRGPKVYLWTHGWYGKETRIQRFLKHIYYHFADGIFVYGDRAKQLMIQEGFDKNILFPIHNSLDYEAHVAIREEIAPSLEYENHFKNKYPVLIFIGRLTKVKQLDLLINAVAILAHNKEYYNLVFVGDGEERTYLESKVHELKIENNVWFYGACYDEKQNAELLYNADLCVAPGNIGLTAMHALSFGTPCITHNSFEWQMPEYEAIIDGVTGAFFERNNIKSLSEAISNWFKNKATSRNAVREACIKEIDDNWNTDYQIRILKNVLERQ